MRKLLRSLMMLPAILLFSCSQDDQSRKYQEKSGTESGLFKEFQHPEEYADIVEKAEAGDVSSIEKLHQYYSNFPHTDLRNLEYWSDILSKKNGRISYTNLIVSLSSHGFCEKSWSFVDREYSVLSEFPFYSKTGKMEYIDNKCEREVFLNKKRQ